ncbi:NUDIX domain-containing protein [Nocardioides aestuarii]|uniref:NUDIX domain-containing protein n=1 Tax=Nocardioides aestuarii TaxID=252231 RepID=A0ABW4TQ62_9ACTN
MSRLRLTAAVTVDLVVLTVRDGSLCVLVVRRGVAPYAGELALPGGFVTEGEDLPEAALRELAEETGVSEVGGHLEQLATFGRPDRDPRGRVVSTAYLALLPRLPDAVAGSDAAEATWLPVSPAGAPLGAETLAFDHDEILALGLERARAKLEYSPLATAFCEPEFTVAELRRVYESVWGQPLDPRNFHRKVTGTEGFLEPTGQMTAREPGRPAQLYRAGTARLLHPAMLRPA